MTRVDFYILERHPDHGRELLACRIAEKAVGRGLRVHVHVDDAAQGERLDQLMWTFRDGSFLPHAIGDGSEAETPVSIHHAVEPVGHEVLINLAREVPVFFSRFERVAEVIDSQPDTREAGRERFRFYRERGYALETHRIEALGP
ncbi:MAG: DNA polymerase III subunit chi [Gammaproteobacteria bacterium]|nr:MAG: DNA polymerase III subunit chi [Gammaproteobacteria bacterium]